MVREEARLMRALGDETKLKIIQHLLGGEVCSCEFIAITGRAQSTVSTHVRDMERQGILQSRSEGRNRIYSIKDKRVKKLCAALNIKKSRG